MWEQGAEAEELCRIACLFESMAPWHHNPKEEAETTCIHKSGAPGIGCRQYPTSLIDSAPGPRFFFSFAPLPHTPSLGLSQRESENSSPAPVLQWLPRFVDGACIQSIDRKTACAPSKPSLLHLITHAITSHIRSGGFQQQRRRTHASKAEDTAAAAAAASTQEASQTVMVRTMGVGKRASMSGWFDWMKTRSGRGGLKFGHDCRTL